MTSATKPKRVYSPQDTQRLLTWLKQRQPQVYTGLVRRFTPPERAQLAGIWDSITGAVSSVGQTVTNFLNSEGAAKLFQAAQPFLQTELEKKQLNLNLQRLQSGLPLQQYPTASAGATSILPYGTDPSLLVQPTAQPVPWGWIAGGAIGIAALLALSRR